jgi:hypothetical protein
MKIRTRMSMSADGYLTTPERDVHLIGGTRTIETYRAL